jgi:hypothetical protein
VARSVNFLGRKIMSFRNLTVLSALAFIALGSVAQAADTYTQGYYKKDGTYVAPHYSTAPNETKNDNYSTRGNVNPYTGTTGTKPRDEDTFKPYTAPKAPEGSSYTPYKSPYDTSKTEKPKGLYGY